MKIDYVWQFNAALARGPWAWPGAYPVYFILADGEALSFEAAEQEQALIRNAIISGADKQWQVVGAEVNWEDQNLTCAHTEKPIPSAYGCGE